MNIGIIGLGKLGLDCAEVFAEHYTVRGYDPFPRRSKSVIICDTVAEVIKKSDWIFIAVPTPHAVGYDGATPSSHLQPQDFGYDAVKSTLVRINEHADTPKRVVLISTVLPGTVRKQLASMLFDQHRLLYNPYLIAMGSIKWDMINPEMVIIGGETADHPDIQRLVDLYKPLMENNPRYVIGTWDECEAIKIFYNTFISAKIGLVNMIQDFALKIGNINVDVVTNALAQSTMRIMGPKYMTAGMGDAGSCHPRDNIALRWLAKEYDVGYDMFDTIMSAREVQAENLAKFLIAQSQAHDNLPIVIHGKTYKPDVAYCAGSYSMLIGHYINAAGHSIVYVDPIADDQLDTVASVDEAAVILMAHNTTITYGYTGEVYVDTKYFEFAPGSIIVDPWRQHPDIEGMTVVHYGNTRERKHYGN